MFNYSSNDFYLPQYEVLIPYYYINYHDRFTFFTQRALKLNNLFARRAHKFEGVAHS